MLQHSMQYYSAILIIWDHKSWIIKNFDNQVHIKKNVNFAYIFSLFHYSSYDHNNSYKKIIDTNILDNQGVWIIGGKVTLYVRITAEVS